jgi:hypothetical protein
VGKWGGLALEISSFVGPCEIARADRRVLFGAQKTSKTVRTGPYKSLVHRWFYEHENALIVIAGPTLLEREYEV